MFAFKTTFDNKRFFKTIKSYNLYNLVTAFQQLLFRVC